MFKNIQLKIMLIFFLVGILIIGGLGAFFVTSLNDITVQINSNQVTRCGASFK